MPQGTGQLHPAVSVTYNSQGGNGVVGWGTGIKGLSVITRGMKTVYHDGSAKGITHGLDDAYYLDGTRLIHVSGMPGYPGALYNPENSPATKVYFRGTPDACWIEVKLPDGHTLSYGNTDDSRQTYTNKSGYKRTNAWYINRTEDINGNYMTYQYLSDNGMVYPQEIVYGKNKNKDTGTYSYVRFAYEQRPDRQELYIEDSKFVVAQRLKYIESGTGSSMFRHYDISYTTGDLSGKSFSRLYSITEQNAQGNKRPPVVLDWDFLPAFSQNTATPSINLKKSQTLTSGSHSVKTEIGNEVFMACDMTGNGLDDIVELATFTKTETYPGAENTECDTKLYIYKARMNNGAPSYDDALTFSLGVSGNLEEIKIDCNKLASYQLDFDGDGLADICIPEYVDIGDNKNRHIMFSVVRGKEVAAGNNTYKYFNYKLKSDDKAPDFASADIDGNGRTEIIILEKKPYNGKYVCEIIGHKNENDTYRYEFQASLPAAPENLYTGDFNNDGMPDLIVFYKDGYKIYFNNGGQIESGSIFSEHNVKLGNTIGHTARMFQGDFNGDGLPDFLTNDTNSFFWYFALGNGDGTFSKTFACSSDLHKYGDNDDDKMQCLVFDFNNDGKTDVVMTNYIEKTKQTHTNWMRSTGSGLAVAKQATSSSEDDALASRYTLGNFTGNGQAELMNYGYDCYNGTGGGSEPKIHIYYNENYTAGSGKVKAVTDETGRKFDIAYSSLAEKDVYSRGTGSEYPIIDCIAPLHVIKSLKTDNGAAGNSDVNYKYKGIKIHAAGRGLLGLSSVTVTDRTTGNIVETGIDSWDAECFAPTETFVKKTMGSLIETNVTTNTYKRTPNKTFVLEETVTTTTDPEQLCSTSTKKYNPQDGTLLSVKQTGNVTDSYHEIVYSDFTDIAGMHLPQTLTYKDLHYDASDHVERQSRIKYNERGLKISECANSGSSLPVTTEYSYDEFGNLVSSSISGYGIDNLQNINEYDESGRFVTKEYSIPASSVICYTHDTWGNILTETDKTNAASPLVTEYTYDAWGNEVSVTSPTGAKAEITRGWNGDMSKRYYVLRQADGEPWGKTWYDSMGREVLKESVGLKDIDVRTETQYDQYGMISRVTSQTGDVSDTKTYQYDRAGRLTSETSSNAGTITYSYSGPYIIMDDNGHRYVKETGDWGLTKSIMEPLGNVYYTYNSFSQPIEVDVLSGSSVVRMEYDDLGNRTVLDDPDAGRTTYTHDALGRIRTRTDARGHKTSYTFDSFGNTTRILKNDATFAEYTYGTAGSNAQRLVKEQSGSLYTAYSYDEHGRMSSKTRHIGDEKLTYSYTYNNQGKVTRIVYPGGVTADYAYDCYGNNTSISVGGKTVWSIEDNTGKSLTVKLGENILEETESDDSGRTTARTLKIKSGNKDTYDKIYVSAYSYDKPTGNLTSKKIATSLIEQAGGGVITTGPIGATGPISGIGIQGNSTLNPPTIDMPNPQIRPGEVYDVINETYSYDNYDRLIQVNRKEDAFQTMEYDDNGNILSKTKVGTYNYDRDKVHALTGIDVTGGEYSPGSQDVSYNFLGKAETVSEWSGDEHRELLITYGPDMERWKSVLTVNNEEKRTVLYSDDYERVCEDSVTSHFYYIGANVIYVRQTGREDRICYATTDNQGSILCIVDESGRKVFEATYDAWGKQNITTNKIGFIRGYTGHEMLTEFELVNMNGRIYDPVTSRFLSPDNYVQMPENSQSFNRYTYCLNNPLKYTDPDGQWFGIDDLLIAGIGFAAGYISNGLMSGNWGWESVKAGLYASASSWVGFNTAGMATGTITSATLQQGLNVGINTLLQPITIPVTDHFSASFSPLWGFGTGGFSFGTGWSIGYTNGDISIQAGIGFGNNYSGWNVGASYKEYGGNFGITTYESGSFHGQKIGTQKVATAGINAGNISFRLSNDLWGDGFDRWRTSAAELSIGNFSVGTYVDTNWGAMESPVYTDKKTYIGKDKIIGKNTSWNNGKVYSAPFWIGYRWNNKNYRLGISHPYVQSLTQNFVHKYITPTPFFLDYTSFKSGIFSYSGNYNPFTLWNY